MVSRAIRDEPPSGVNLLGIRDVACLIHISSKFIRPGTKLDDLDRQTLYLTS